MSEDSNVQFIIPNESLTRDKTTYIKVGFRRGKTTLWLPARNIIEFGMDEDMHETWWTGTLQFWDPNGQIIKGFGFTGEEEMVLGFGGDEDNRWDGGGKILTLAGYDYSQQGGIATLFFRSSSFEGAANSEQASYAGSISDIINDILKKLCLSEKIQVVPTLNAGEYINPGMSRTEFIEYLKRLAISRDGVSSYQAFSTKDTFYFTPRDHFNRQDSSFSFNEIPSRTNYRNTIIGTKITPYNGHFEHSLGISRRLGVGYNYEKGKITEDFNVDELIRRKTFQGKYIPLARQSDNLPTTIEYTGLRNEDDVKGYVTGRAERNMERMSQLTADVPGNVALSPGKSVNFSFKTDDPDNPKESYLSGKWVVEKAVHQVSPAGGYTTRLHCSRNAVPDISDELLLKKAKKIKET